MCFPLTVPIGIPSIVSHRDELVHGLISLAEEYRLVLVRGTPACGKTTIRRLVVNVLLATRPKMPVYVLNGWKRERVLENNGWDNHFKKCTGIRGEMWPTTPAFLLFDECQQSFWDEDLWSGLIKEVNPFSPISESPRIIFFSSYGSPGRGNAGFDSDKYFQTPPYFGEQQTVSMRIEENQATGISHGLHLLLSQHEAFDMMHKYVNGVGLPLSEELMLYLYIISEGHAGCLAALMGTLDRDPVSLSHIPITLRY